MSENYLANLNDIFKGSEVVYNFLSRSYFEPVSDTYFQMLNDLKEYFIMLKTDDNTLLNNGIEGIIKAAEDRNLLSGKKLSEYDTDILREYTTLFCLGSIAIPMSESVYTSDENIEMQQSRDDMLELFRKENIDPRKLYNEPEDHIGFETYIMSYYNKKGAEYAEQGQYEMLEELIDKQLNIHTNHFNLWIKTFTDNIRNSPIRKIFYDKLADFTDGYISENYKFLLELKKMLTETKY